jgi:hypothetical protein
LDVERIAASTNEGRGRRSASCPTCARGAEALRQRPRCCGVEDWWAAARISENRGVRGAVSAARRPGAYIGSSRPLASPHRKRSRWQASAGYCRKSSIRVSQPIYSQSSIGWGGWLSGTQPKTAPLGCTIEGIGRYQHEDKTVRIVTPRHQTGPTGHPITDAVGAGLRASFAKTDKSPCPNTGRPCSTN